jgi:HEAT repeat protein
MVIAGLLHAVAQFVATSAPEHVERVMTALAEATARLPIDVLDPIVEMQRSAFRPSQARFLQSLVRRISDASIANLIASEVRDGRGSSRRLGEAFCGLAPDPVRRTEILALARGTVDQTCATADPVLAQAWQQSEKMLLTYSDNKAFVSDAYDAELSRLTVRAVELDEDHTDPVERMSAWRGTVDDDHLRLLDASLLADLMRLQQGLAHWRDIADLARQRTNVLLAVGDFPAAAVVVEALRSQSERPDDADIRAAAAEILQNIPTASAMQQVASHLDTSDHSVVHAARRLCMALGTVSIGALAEVLSREERNRPRKHLVDILVGFGAPGRQSVEPLRQSPNMAVRRTAVLLLREFGGHEALPELESLLNDAEPQVQREATRAIAMLGVEAAYTTLIRALERGPDRARTSILGVLWTLPDEDAEQVLSYVVLAAPYRGMMWVVHKRAIQRLGSLGGRHGVNALSAVLQRREFWSPFRMAALHRLAVDALGQIGTPDAVATIETVASCGPWWARAAARATLGAATREGPQR